MAFFGGQTPIDELESTSYWMKSGAYLTSRELFTGVTAHGTTTWGSKGGAQRLRFRAKRRRE